MRVTYGICAVQNLPPQHSLLLQHRNATVHNNESGASVAADAWTNVHETHRSPFRLFRDSCHESRQILCAALQYRKDWRLATRLNRMGRERKEERSPVCT